MIRTNILWILIIVLLTSCSNKIGKKTTSKKVEEESLNFDFGKLNDGVYENDFFELKIPYDKTWSVQDKSQMDNLSKLGKELIAGDNEELKSIIKASEVNSANLFALFEHEYGAPVAFNPSFFLIAENTALLPGIKRGKDYLFHAKKLMEQTKVSYNFDKEIYEKKIGDVTFDVMEITGAFSVKNLTQEYYSTVKKGFSLSIIISYTTEEQKTKLHSMLDGISFRN